MRKICLTFLCFKLSVASAQLIKKTYLFDNYINNVVLFSNVNDSLLLLRNVPSGIEWNIYDSSLNIVKSRIIQTEVEAPILMAQLFPTGKKLIYLKQRILGNVFDVMVKNISITDSLPFVEPNVLYRETITNNKKNLHFNFASSANDSFHILYRPEITGDSAFAHVILVDHSLRKKSERVLSFPPPNHDEFLLYFGVDNSGDPFCIIGNDFNSYVLGTTLRCYFFNSKGTRTTEIRLAKKKIAKITIAETDNEFLFHCTTSPSNTDNNISGFVSIAIDKSNMKANLTEAEVSPAIKQQLGKMLRVEPSKVLNMSYWYGFEKFDNKNFVLAGLQAPRKDYISKARPASTSNPDIHPVFDQRGNEVDEFDKQLRTRQYINDGVRSEYAADPERTYREVFLAVDHSRSSTPQIIPVYHPDFKYGLPFAKMLFVTDAGIKLIGSTERNGYKMLAESVLTSNTLSKPQLLFGSENCIIDGSVAPVMIGENAYTLFINMKSGMNGLLKVR